MEAAAGKSVILSSGNILAKSIALKTGNDAADGEVFESLHSCLEGANKTIQNGKVYEVMGEDMKNNNEDVDRQELKISLKVFLYSLERDDIISAVEKGIQLTGVESLDSLVVAFSTQSEGTPISLDLVKHAWLVIEELVSARKVEVVGVSDVETQLFIQLHKWAQVKPGIISINLASCCVVPPELAEFSKNEGIQLLTHSDQTNALSHDKLKLLIDSLTSRNVLHSEAMDPWELKWVLSIMALMNTMSIPTTLLKDAKSTWNLLNGVVCLYKPQGISVRTTLDILRRKLCEDLNAMERIPRKDIVQIKRVPAHCASTPPEHNFKIIHQINDGNGVVQVLNGPSYADHPLVIGPGYLPEDVKLSPGSFLGKESSGLLVVGVNKGCNTAELIHKNKWMKTYVISGQFGKATNTYFHTGKILEKATFHNIKKHMIDRVLSAVQGSQQQLAFSAAGVRLDSQRAFELASKGIVRPENSKYPIVYSAKCTSFSLPDFELEINLINDKEIFLWQFIHELGFKLRSVAVCTKVRCVKVGPFTLDLALLLKHWTLEYLIQNINQTENILKKINTLEREPLIENY